jgi:hypothetical protein
LLGVNKYTLARHSRLSFFRRKESTIIT